MKILLPYRDSCDRKITSSVVSGGGEQFCKLIYNNFDVESYQGCYPVPSKAEDRWSISEKYEVQEKIVKRAKDIGAKIIISNFPSAIYNGKIIVKSKIPVMIVMHNRFKMRSIFSRLNKANESGHSVFLVSEHQKKYYQEFSDREHARWPDDKSNLMFDVAGYIRPSFCIGEKPNIKDKFDYDCGTIGRCDNQKKPFLLRELVGDDCKTLVMTSQAQEEGQSGYYNRMKKLYKNDKNVSWNDTHKDLMKKLSTCKTYFSTWNGETWGITAMEALSCGIPVILNSDKSGNHASEIIPASKEHYKIIPQNDKDALVKAIEDLKDVDREEIQKMTWEKHSLKSWKEHMRKCMEDTVDKFDKLKNKK